VDHPYLVVYSATSNPTGPTTDPLPGAHPNDDLYHTAPDPTAGGPSGAGVLGGGSSSSRGAAAAAGGLPAQGEDGCCGLCHDPVEDVVVAACGHAFCRTCVAEYIESLQRVRRRRAYIVSQLLPVVRCMLAHIPSFKLPPVKWSGP
jgi:DNA repair protein RAD16